MICLIHFFMFVVTLLPTPTTRYMPWSSNPLFSRPARQSCTKLNPDSSRKVWLALLGFPPGVWAYLPKRSKGGDFPNITRLTWALSHQEPPSTRACPPQTVLAECTQREAWKLKLCINVVLYCSHQYHLSSGMMSKQNLLSMASAAFLIQDFSLKLSVFVILASRWLYGIMQNVLGDSSSKMNL